jgi:hypothetical protein
MFYYCLFELSSTFSEQLPLRFEPVRLSIARQSESAAAFGNEVGPEPNGII